MKQPINIEFLKSHPDFPGVNYLNCHQWCHLSLKIPFDKQWYLVISTGIFGMMSSQLKHLRNIDRQKYCGANMSKVCVFEYLQVLSWWRHQTETFSSLLTLRVGNSPLTDEFPSQRPVTRSFDAFFDLRLNKQSIRLWFETPSRSLWPISDLVFDLLTYMLIIHENV